MDRRQQSVAGLPAARHTEGNIQFDRLVVTVEQTQRDLAIGAPQQPRLDHAGEGQSPGGGVGYAAGNPFRPSLGSLPIELRQHPTRAHAQHVGRRIGKNTNDHRLVVEQSHHQPGIAAVHALHGALNRGRDLGEHLIGSAQPVAAPPASRMGGNQGEMRRTQLADQIGDGRPGRRHGAVLTHARAQAVAGGLPIHPAELRIPMPVANGRPHRIEGRQVERTLRGAQATPAAPGLATRDGDDQRARQDHRHGRKGLAGGCLQFDSQVCRESA
jgi:hypothetical protein